MGRGETWRTGEARLEEAASRCRPIRRDRRPGPNGGECRRRDDWHHADRSGRRRPRTGDGGCRLRYGRLLRGRRCGGATVVVPPTSTANVSRHGPRSSARDRTILVVKERGRRRWKKTSGYHGQARVENAFFRYKSIIGDSLRACSPAGRGTEVDLACNILNQMTGLGRPMSYRIGR